MVQVNGILIIFLVDKYYLDLDVFEVVVCYGGWVVYFGKGYISFVIVICVVKLSEVVFVNVCLVCLVFVYSEIFEMYVGQLVIIGKDGVESVMMFVLIVDE